MPKKKAQIPRLSGITGNIPNVSFGLAKLFREWKLKIDCLSGMRML